MELTLRYIRSKFNDYNLEYFKGELNTPTFAISKRKHQLGSLSWKWTKDIWGNLKAYNFTITISEYYDRTEREVDNTLIHEMIHLYIRQNNLKDNKPHGRLFYSIANRINEEGGWNISATNSAENCGLSDKSKQIIVGCYKKSDNTCFIFGINKNKVRYYKSLFHSYPKHFKQYLIFKTNDTKTFGHLCECRSAIRGWEKPISLMNNIIHNEKEIMYAYTEQLRIY